MNKGDAGFSVSVSKVFLRSIAILFVFAGFGPAHGQLVFTAGSHDLQPNMPGQTLEFLVQNNGSAVNNVRGLDFLIQISEDGSEGPSITAVDIITGTPFESNNSGPVLQDGGPHLKYWRVETTGPSSPVTLPSGATRMARVTFDTTGLNSGTWGLFFDTAFDTAYSDTSNNAIPMTINNGSLTVVPEPSHYAAMAGAGCLIWAVVRRRKSASAASSTTSLS